MSELMKVTQGKFAVITCRDENTAASSNELAFEVRCLHADGVFWPPVVSVRELMTHLNRGPLVNPALSFRCDARELDRVHHLLGEARGAMDHYISWVRAIDRDRLPELPPGEGVDVDGQICPGFRVKSGRFVIVPEYVYCECGLEYTAVFQVDGRDAFRINETDCERLQQAIGQTQEACEELKQRRQGPEGTEKQGHGRRHKR